MSVPIFLGTAARRAHGSSAEHAMRDLIASNAPLRARRKSPWGKLVGTKHVRLPPKHYSRGFKGPPIGAPPKPNVSGFGGERRSSGTTELLPRKAKRRMWSLRRRGTPFSPIFRRATKDGVPEGPTEKRMPVKRKNARLRPRRAYRKENAGKNVKS